MINYDQVDPVSLLTEEVCVFAFSKTYLEIGDLIAGGKEALHMVQQIKQRGKISLRERGSASLGGETYKKNSPLAD